MSQDKQHRLEHASSNDQLHLVAESLVPYFCWHAFLHHVPAVFPVFEFSSSRLRIRQLPLHRSEDAMKRAGTASWSASASCGIFMREGAHVLGRTHLSMGDFWGEGATSKFPWALFSCVTKWWFEKRTLLSHPWNGRRFQMFREPIGPSLLTPYTWASRFPEFLSVVLAGVKTYRLNKCPSVLIRSKQQ